MKFCIYGAGAIGGHEKLAQVTASDDPHSFSQRDFVLCPLKAHQAYESAQSFAPLLGPETAVLTAMNGVPWWYFYKVSGRFDRRCVESVDRDRRQWESIGPQRVIGCVANPASEVVAPGIVQHYAFKRFTIGEPDGIQTQRVFSLSEALIGARFEAPVRDNIRWNIWLKLWGNDCCNPISALTGADKMSMLQDLERGLIQERGRTAGLYELLETPRLRAAGL
ncbi:MAG: 2-dehydropantoate 2-reductase N-terminal domain-containing protein [Steroidobacteraceae bacterium]|jgi:2-dehydropantoate 2-reductase